MGCTDIERCSLFVVLALTQIDGTKPPISGRIKVARRSSSKKSVVRLRSRLPVGEVLHMQKTYAFDFVASLHLFVIYFTRTIKSFP